MLTSGAILLGLAYWRTGELGDSYRLLAIFSSLLMFIVYRLLEVFDPSRGRARGLLQVTKGWIVTIFIALALGFITKTTQDFSRLVIGGWVAGAYLAQVAGFLFSFWLAQKRYVHFSAPLRTLVVGSEVLAKHLVGSLNKNVWLPDQVIGVVDNSPNAQFQWNAPSAPWLGRTDDIAAIVDRQKIRRVYIALPLNRSNMVETLYRELLDKNIDIVWAPDIFALKLLNHGVREVAGVPLLSLSESPMADEGRALVKAVMDYTIAPLMLICLSPILIATAIAIKLTSRGPVFYKQKRHGWDSRVIDVWKFRSMIVHREEEDIVSQATRGDARVTPVGRFIRRTSIDELPQLFNVLNGTMSLVGPRPHALQHNEYYSKHIKSYMIRHRLKPGITGLAQVNGYRGETECVEKMEKRVIYDIDYINRWSIWLDLKILIKTPFTLFRKDIY
jgi:putative colanic acid biosynthesis UDP-glucose lipid carrier transferase